MNKEYIRSRKLANKKSNKKTTLIVFGFIILMILILLAWFLLQIMNPVKFDHEVKFNIEYGQGVNQISANLFKQNIIRDKFSFETYVFLKGVEHKFKAGEYNLPAVINMRRLVEILTFGQPAEEWQLTVIEGWTATDIAAKLEEIDKFESENFLKSAGNNKNQPVFNSQDYDFLIDKPETASLEGYLFPDTYRYFEDADIRQVIKKMLDNFDAKLNPKMKSDIKNQGKTVFDIIIMASIIEREVRTDDDRAIVSGIFWKRLQSGVPLEADSTINYITGKKTPAVSSTDLEINSPYNTYMYPDLPPGPISNPGLASIEAAIYPQESEYWFFLTDKDGHVHYGRDFEEHKRNKAKYLY